MEAVGVALDREALAAARSRVRARRSSGSSRRSTPTSGTSSRSAARSSSSRSCSTSCTCRRASGRRRASPPTRRCWRICAAAHPMIDKLLEWRIYTKLRSTYVEALPTLLVRVDGRLHTTFHQAVAATGRLSSSDPNLQNIPIRTRARPADPARVRRRRSPDACCVAADYSQIELRILAHVSGDVHLKEAFERGRRHPSRDRRARAAQGRPTDVTADERSMAKMVNFGLAYGMSDFGLSSRAGHPAQEAQEFINSYFAAYSGISYYMIAHQGDGARQQGYVDDAARPRGAIPELQARNPSAARRRRADGDQHADPGHRRRHRQDRDDPARRAAAPTAGFRARLLLQVHDELLLEVPRDEVDRLVPVVRETMESGAAARRAADGRRQGRRRLGVDDAADPRRRGRSPRPTSPPRHRWVASAPSRCLSCPRSRPSRAISRPLARRRRRSSGARSSWPRTLRTQDPDGFAARRRRSDGRGDVAAGEAARHRPVGRRRPRRSISR